MQTGKGKRRIDEVKKDGLMNEGFSKVPPE
jgi:hypothetical protein